MKLTARCSVWLFNQRTIPKYHIKSHKNYTKKPEMEEVRLRPGKPAMAITDSTCEDCQQGNIP